MQFSSLKLSGFKSFLEPTELEIAQGLTGIVGPNGCGKSNLVEALRWVMGESSAKRMRGDGMDDVIFGGSDKRPARNLAQVSLVVDSEGLNTALPAPFSSAAQLEVMRRIERGEGSEYRVNGKSVRAKDVALLFQDNGTGPHSASIVSQGRIGALIAAKPTERRLLLEEAAGITGLHSRRHEAELRLKQAETNLTRVEDVMGTMDAQLNLLKKQARQASRYRNINAELRRQEAMLLHLKWSHLHRQLADAHEAYKLADQHVATLMLDVAKIETARLEASDVLPALRQEEARKAAALQRLVVAREQIEAESVRVSTALENARGQRIQVENDRVREAGLAEDAQKAIHDIQGEIAALEQHDDSVETQKAHLLKTVETALHAREEAENIVAHLQKELALTEADVLAVERRLNDHQNRKIRAEQKREQNSAERTKIEAQQLTDLFVHSAQEAVEQAEQALKAAQTQVDADEQKRTQTENTVQAARLKLNEADAALSGINAEVKAIQRILAAGQNDFAPALDQIEADKGYEQALAAALGDDLSLPLNSEAPAYWHSVSTSSPSTSASFAAEIDPLLSHVRAPQALTRRLAHIGVVSSDEEAEKYFSALSPGQCLVTKEGAAWRWDGVCIKTGAPTPAALKLQQRNRLSELEKDHKNAEESKTFAAHVLAKAQEDAAQSSEALKLNRTKVNEAHSKVSQTKRVAAEAEAALAAQATKLAAIREVQDRLQSELATLSQELDEINSIKAALPDVQSQRAKLAEARTTLAHKQNDAAEAEASRRQFDHGIAQRQQRLNALRSDKEKWLSRSSGASERMVELEKRQRDSEELISTLSTKPSELSQQRDVLLEKIREAQTACTTSSDTLAEAETIARSLEQEMRQTEGKMTDAREERARLQTHVSTLQQAQSDLYDRIDEKCSCTPEALLNIAEVQADRPLPEPEMVEARIEKILREREALGPVNLRAEQEAEEQQTQIDLMISEKQDLLDAIAKLRHGISSLNKEARERLLAAFDDVQKHFITLFHSLFGGGSAELRLTEADDPLNAGLEIIASPPGKKLQNLTLLSGGEQALTSLALLFAVFLVNPSPICVLDEVDAPLDEANIDRFCSLLEHMVREGTTRFLVITHQRLTMSRMDRLYGVTMMEKGVSKLVSVDLQSAESLKESAAA